MEVFNTIKALPNKLLNADGSITDFQGNILSPADDALAEVYKRSKSIANKFLDNDGEVKTYAEISLDIFVVVDELPEFGEKNKIYLVPSKDVEGSFDEYFWNENDKWDKIGEVKIDLSNYPTKEQVAEAIAANSVEDKKYTDEKISQISVEPQVFFWNETDGMTSESTIKKWNTIIDTVEKQDVVVIVSCNKGDDNYYIPYTIPKGKNLKMNRVTMMGPNIFSYCANYASNTLVEAGKSYLLTIQYDVNNNTVKRVETAPSTKQTFVLATTVDYSSPYMPTYDGSPATKKYVDNEIKNKVTDVLGGMY